MINKKIAIIGCGNMGIAIVDGLINHGIDISNLLLIEKLEDKRKEIEKRYGLKVKAEIKSSIKDYKVIIISVKPAQVKDILKELSHHINKEHLLISVAAGVSVSFIEKHLGTGFQVVRTMPNIAARFGEAVVGVCFNKSVTDTGRIEALETMKCIGKVVEVEENKMDALTGLSGSGPAFVFLVIEALSDAGVLMGLPRDISIQLAVQTVYGASCYLKKLNIHPSLAKEMVTSPGGTTIEGLMELERGGLKGLIMEAVKKASEKAEKLVLKDD